MSDILLCNEDNWDGSRQAFAGTIWAGDTSASNGSLEPTRQQPQRLIINQPSRELHFTGIIQVFLSTQALELVEPRFQPDFSSAKTHDNAQILQLP